MIDALAFAITVLAGVSALAVAGAGAAGYYRRAACTPTLIALQAGLVVQAVFDIVALARGHRSDETATHIAYLVASLVFVPLAAYETRRDDGAWSATLLAVGLVVVAVLVIRMAATWR